MENKLFQLLFNKFNKVDIFCIISFILCLLFSLIFGISYKYLLLVSIFMQILNIYRYREFNAIIIFSIFTILYYISLLPYYFLGINISVFYWNFNGNNDEKTLLIYSLFSLGLFVSFFFLKKNNYENSINLESYVRKSNLIFYACLGIIIYTILFGNEGSFTLLTGGYGAEEVSSSFLNEYILIFFLIAYLYSGRNKSKNIILIVLAAAYSVVNFLYGGRIPVIQLSLLMFYIYFDKKMNYKQMLVLVILGITSIGIIGGLRNGTLFPENKNSLLIISTNHTEIFSASVSFIDVIEKGLISSYERFQSLFYYLMRIFTSTDNMPPIGNLSGLVYNLSNTSLGGGFIAAYFYVWFSFLGPLIAGLVCGSIFISIYKQKIDIIQVFLILIISTFPRWLVYDPITMIKLPLYGLILYILSKIFHFCFYHYFTKKKDNLTMNQSQNNPKISIIVPCYNVENFIDKTIKSLINQTYRNIEIILINDGSTDETEVIINNYLFDSRIKYIKQNNMGVSRTRNKGINVATGDYICFLDGDDLYEPSKIEEQVRKIVDTKSKVCYTNVVCEYIDKSKKNKYNYNDKEGKILLDYIVQKSFIHINDLMIERNFLIENNLFFNKDYVYGEDANFFMKVLSLANVVCVNKYLTRYMINNQSASFKKSVRKNSEDNYITDYIEWAKKNRKNIIYSDIEFEEIINSLNNFLLPQVVIRNISYNYKFDVYPLSNFEYNSLKSFKFNYHNIKSSIKFYFLYFKIWFNIKIAS